MRKKKFFIFGVLMVLLVSALLIFTGCPSSESIGHIAKYIYMTDTYNGRVYTYDLDTHTASSTPIVSTGQNATGAIYFYDDKGYICVGYSTGGIYTFDPNSTSPTITKFSSLSFSAQYIAFLNPTTAFVTDYGEWDKPTETGGVYLFDPSDSNSSFTFITGTIGTSQDIKICGGKVYVASYGNNKLLVIDANNNYSVKSYDIPLGTNPTGLAISSDETKIYISNTGTYGNTDGTISVFDIYKNTIETFVSELINPTLMAATDTYLYVIGYSNTYAINISTKVISELKTRDGSSFGGSSILIHDNLLYISNFDYNTKISKLYIFNTSTNKQVDYSPISVGKDGEDGITGLAAY